MFCLVPVFCLVIGAFVLVAVNKASWSLGIYLEYLIAACHGVSW